MQLDLFNLMESFYDINSRIALLEEKFSDQIKELSDQIKKLEQDNYKLVNTNSKLNEIYNEKINALNTEIVKLKNSNQFVLFGFRGNNLMNDAVPVYVNKKTFVFDHKIKNISIRIESLIELGVKEILLLTTNSIQWFFTNNLIFDINEAKEIEYKKLIDFCNNHKIKLLINGVWINSYIK